uniref:Integrin beta-1-like isoform X2 n=1 Tax=Crassostrea virginica TaxID=6565 RepID=A0A8B8EP81_CRAVI|nr:integrin beta-1-like isoform X2 [Crassostrea virginica]
MKAFCLLSLALFFTAVLSDDHEPKCFGSTCEECMKNSEKGECIWCGAANFTAGPRCFYVRDFGARGQCGGGMVRWPTKLTYIKARQLNDNVIIGNDIIRFEGRKGGEAEHTVAVRVPGTYPRKKKVAAVFVLPALGQNEPVQLTFDILCNNRIASPNNPNKQKCKMLRREEEFTFKVKIKYLEDMTNQKRKYKLKVKIGKQKQILRIIAQGIQPCQCSTKETKASKCKWKDGKGSKGNSKCVCSDSGAPVSSMIEAVQPAVPALPSERWADPEAGRTEGVGQALSVYEDEIPMGSPSSYVECENCEETCRKFTPCVQCFLSEAPKQDSMCRLSCAGGSFVPTFRRVQGFPDDFKKCIYDDSLGCERKFQVVGKALVEVSMKQDCQADPCQTATCPTINGEICNGKGMCNCGACVCSAGYAGPSCEDCLFCGGFCAELRPCVRCLVRSDFGETEECNQICGRNRFKIIETTTPIVQGPSFANYTMCEFYDTNSCLHSYGYARSGNDVTEIKVHRQKVCPVSDGK